MLEPFRPLTCLICRHGCANGTKAAVIEAVFRNFPALPLFNPSSNVMTPTNHQAAREVYQRIADNIAKVMQGQAGAARKLLAALAGGGHVLLEDFPGTGKTTFAK